MHNAYPNMYLTYDAGSGAISLYVLEKTNMFTYISKHTRASFYHLHYIFWSSKVAHRMALRYK